MPRVLVAVLVLLAACDRDAWSPRAEHARDLHDRAAVLATHLEALPGVTRASVVLDEATADPLAPPSPTPPPRASIVLAITATADADALSIAARDAAVAAVRDLAARDVVVTARHEPAAASMASVGPFRVEPSSREPLLATLAGALALIAALAGWIAVSGLKDRRRRR